MFNLNVLLMFNLEQQQNIKIFYKIKKIIFKIYNYWDFVVL